LLLWAGWVSKQPAALIIVRECVVCVAGENAPDGAVFIQLGYGDMLGGRYAACVKAWRSLRCAQVVAGVWLMPTCQR